MRLALVDFLHRPGMATLASNRLRHIARRIREVPLGFLVRKIMHLGRRAGWWGVAVSRRFLPAPTMPSSVFLSWSAALQARVRSAFQADDAFASALARRCADVLERQLVPCLGYGEVPIPSSIGWHSDSVSGYRWPLRYFARVNFLTHGVDADVKVPWELSRLQWVVWLAEGALVHSDPAARAECKQRAVSVISDWDAANPLGYGPNWTVAMEVAIRSINLGLSAALLWDTVDANMQRRLLRMLFEHHRYLTAFPEISDHVGNHYLLNITGRMFLEGVVFERIAPSFERRWESDLREQFEPDGLHIEHAPTYHRLCVEAAMWTVAFASRGGLSTSDSTRVMLRRAIQALDGLAGPGDGVLPVLGDSDSGEVLAFGGANRDCLALRRLMGAAPGGVDYLVATAGDESGRVLDRWPDCSAPSESVSRFGPFLCARWGHVGFVVRAGPHGLHGRASHDHDDNASPWITWDGEDLFVEAGCFAYTRSLAERELDLASRSHNLVTIGEALRFPPRPGSIGPVVSAAPIATVKLPVAAGHPLTVTTRWTDSAYGDVSHERVLTHGDSRVALVVRDDVDVSDGTPCVLRWHVAPQWAIDPREKYLLLRRDHVRLQMILNAEASQPLDVAMSPFRFSPKYGSRVFGTVIEVRWRGAAKVSMSLSSISHTDISDSR